MIRFISELAKEWMDENFHLRKLALEEGPSRTGFSKESIARGLNGFFSLLTTETLNRLIEQDLGNADRLDKFCSSLVEERGDRKSMANGPDFLVHVTAGNVPNPALMSIVLGLLLRSAQFVKCATGGAFLPRLFAHSIYHFDRKLGACLEVAEWHGGEIHLERVLFDAADCITATGSDETLSKIRLRLSPGKRFVPYGHKVSFSFVGSEMLSSAHLGRVATAAASDVAAWNQLGCLSPHVIYVENGGAVPGEVFAAKLGEELDRLEATEPRGGLTAEGSAVITNRRMIYQLRASSSEETRVWTSENSTAWTVVYELEPRFQGSCLNRFIYVKSVGRFDDVLPNADSVRGKVSTVGLAVEPRRVMEIATMLSKWGVTRVCPIGQMQNPPLTWRHDGRPALGDLVAWTDCEI
jgi:hypothetical protein